MPTLNWIGKEAVVNHHHQVPFHLLKDVPELAAGDPGSGNLIVLGDNLVALKALLPYYAGQVKCIYIDPPYNTGNEGWIYNDNVNSPLIREWLGKAVGREAEDLSRHDKWLCMMYPRLSVLRQFLRRDGAIIVSIDDNESSHLRLVMDEIYGESCFVAELIWKSRQHLDSRSKTGVSLDHEYVLVYARIPGGATFRGKARDTTKYKNPDSDARGPWMSRSILGLATAEQRPNLHYELTDPKTGRKYPCAKSTGWRYSKETMAKLIAEGRILFPKKEGGRPREKLFEANLQTAFTGFPSIIDGVFTDEGTLAIRDILGGQVFSFPKSPGLVQGLVQQVATNPGDLILDSFAGSGTTGHAVLNLNKADGGNRRFILVEIEANIARDITAERVKRVARGYTNAKGETIEGLGGGFRFCELGEPLFDEHGQIKPSVRFADLARHVYFSETGEPLPRERVLKSPLIGDCRGVGIYLLFNGILGDKSANGGNILTRSVLAQLPKFDGQKVIYCAGCLLGKDRLQTERITIRQTPYEIKVS
jgi:site-specific DNA-methyltransferase (adenine-specific)/adenine-specific DNA-methyltransferase